MQSSNKYFSGDLRSAVIDDKYHTWWFKGIFWITSNSCLPNYSYYLDIRSEIGEFNNVPLYWTKTVQTKLTAANTPAYTIDEYQFYFSFNFAQSSQFSENLKYREFEFNLLPMFNQTVIKDFSVTANTQDVQQLIQEMNLSQNTKSVSYTNNTDLAIGKNLVKLNSMNLQQQATLETYVYPPQNTRPYINLLAFKNLTSSFNLIKAEFKIICLNNALEFMLPPKLYTESEVLLQTPYCIYLNDKSEFEINQANNLNGLFAITNNKITITATIKFEYQKYVRTVNLNQSFMFDQQSTSGIFSKLSFERECAFVDNYLELENEKIF